MIGQAKTYNDLIPPYNADYPWTPHDWQLLCYYCAMPIHETKAVAGYKQRTIYMHGRWHHSHTNNMLCRPEELRPDNEIEDPCCHICSSQTVGGHAGHCSFRGKPQHYATPMSDKEHEIERRDARLADPHWFK